MTSGNVTQLLLDLSAGDGEALNKLTPLVYDELKALAQRAMRSERRQHTLGATALVHELYLKLVDQQRAQWQHRAQFFGVAAQLMRRILVDHHRRQEAAKRGGGQQRIDLDDSAVVAARPGVNLTALDEALGRLAAFDPRQSHIVELRYFGGLTIEETAEVVGVSPATVKREWTMARAWLRREIGGPNA